MAIAVADPGIENNDLPNNPRIDQLTEYLLQAAPWAPKAVLVTNAGPDAAYPPRKNGISLTSASICINAYSIIALLPGNVSAAQVGVAEELRKADFGLDEHNKELIVGVHSSFAVLDDARIVQRVQSDEWLILHD